MFFIFQDMQHFLASCPTLKWDLFNVAMGVSCTKACLATSWRVRGLLSIAGRGSVGDEGALFVTALYSRSVAEAAMNLNSLC